MAIVHSSRTRVFFGDVEVTAYVTDIKMEAEARELPVTHLRLLGLPNVEVSEKGMAIRWPADNKPTIALLDPAAPREITLPEK
jgi:hypothetical protein